MEQLVFTAFALLLVINIKAGTGEDSSQDFYNRKSSTRYNRTLCKTCSNLINDLENNCNRRNSADCSCKEIFKQKEKRIKTFVFFNF
jgi:hypothetical protein